MRNLKTQLQDLATQMQRLEKAVQRAEDARRRIEVTVDDDLRIADTLATACFPQSLDDQPIPSFSFFFSKLVGYFRA